MQLLIDIGNTSIKWATFEAGKLGPMSSARHFGGLPIDVIARWEHLPRIEQLLLASVGPDSVKDGVETAVNAYWQCPIRRVYTQAQACGIRVAYTDPSRLGVDRFLAMVGAFTVSRPTSSEGPEQSQHGRSLRPCTSEARRRPILVIDAGTAITFDGVAANGEHLGGQILPGIPTLRDSLLANTRLPPHETLDHTGHWGRDTGPAVAAASLQAPVALAERLARLLQSETGQAPIVFITGGDADRLAPFLDRRVERSDSLVLLGLAQFV